MFQTLSEMFYNPDLFTSCRPLGSKYNGTKGTASDVFLEFDEASIYRTFVKSHPIIGYDTILFAGTRSGGYSGDHWERIWCLDPSTDNAGSKNFYSYDSRIC